MMGASFKLILMTIPSEWVLSELFVGLLNWPGRLDMSERGHTGEGRTKWQRRHTAGMILLLGFALFSKGNDLPFLCLQNMTPNLHLTFLKSKQSSA